MLTRWDDVIARVRGLASRLVGRQRLEELAAARDFPALVNGLQDTAYASVANITTPTGRALERETRRVAGSRSKIIAAWCGPRVHTLAPLFEDEDRRNLRSLTRGVVAHQPPDQCVAGLLPTADLPAAALEELAHSARLADVAATLSAWGNPYGPVMMPEAVRDTPNLFELQLAIDREYASRAVKIAPHAGDQIARYVRLVIDEGNAATALAAASGTVEHEPATLFIPGGELLSASVFGDVARLTRRDAEERLARLFAATPLAPIVASADEARDGAMLTAQLRELRRVVRHNPLTLAVVLEYVLSLRAELQDLARIIWGIALQVPRRRIAERLVTA